MHFDYLEDLVIELKRRQKMAQEIDAILEKSILKDTRYKIRRGLVQTLVAKELGVTMSSRLSTLINERMQLKGFPKCILHGVPFYRNTAIKKPAFKK